MLERVLPRHPSLPPQELTNLPETLVPVAKTLAIIVDTQNGSGQDPRLSQKSRLPLLASGLMHSAGLAEFIGVISTAEGGRLAGEYLEGIDVPRKALILRERKPDVDNSDVLGRMTRDNSLGDVVFVSAGGIDEEITERLKKSGVDLKNFSLEEEIGARIAESMRSSRHALTETLKEALLSVGRLRRPEDINFTRLTLSHA